jgi:hypothetical protein
MKLTELLDALHILHYDFIVHKKIDPEVCIQVLDSRIGPSPILKIEPTSTGRVLIIRNFE